MSKLVVCGGCGRHVRAAAKECPFCARPRRSVVAVVAGLAASAAVGVTLAACYGMPPPPPGRTPPPPTTPDPSATGSGAGNTPLEPVN